MKREDFMRYAERQINDAFHGHINRMMMIVEQAWAEGNRNIEEQPQIIRCKDCKHRPKEPNFETYESGFDLEFPEGSKCPCLCYGDKWYSWYPNDEWFCAYGERNEGEPK